MPDIYEIRRRAIQKRRQSRDQVLGHPKTEELGGLLEQCSRQMAYDREALVGKIVAIYFAFILSLLLAPLTVLGKQSQSERQEQRGKQENPKFRLIYSGYDKERPIYPLGDDGEPDVTKDPLVHPSEINEWVIWKNGYLPELTMIRGYSMCFASFTGEVLGRKAIDPINTLWLYGEQQRKEKSSGDHPAPGAIQGPGAPRVAGGGAAQQ
jgi:hypothetical protein